MIYSIVIARLDRLQKKKNPDVDVEANGTSKHKTALICSDN